MSPRAARAGLLRHGLPPLCALLLLMGGVAAAEDAKEEGASQLPRVELRMPRAFGHHIGDLLVQRLTVDVPAGYALQRGSLPALGNAEYWLELRKLTVAEAPASDAALRRYALTLTWQIFYAPLDVRSLRLPGFPLRFTRDAAALTARVPAWEFTVSPIKQIVSRGVAQGQGKGEREQRFSMPDAAPRPLATTASLQRVGLLAAATLAWFGWMSWRFGWWRARRHSPFGAGLRAVARLRGEGDSDAYRAALRRVHRALDATYGRALFADELPAFLAQRPQFAAQEAALARFFAQSRAVFFGDDGAADDLRPRFDELLALLRECRRLERQR